MLEDEVYFTSLLELLALFIKRPGNPAKLNTWTILRPWVYILKNLQMKNDKVM